jgi:hypothetical protein
MIVKYTHTHLDTEGHRIVVIKNTHTLPILEMFMNENVYGHGEFNGGIMRGRASVRQ